MSNTPKKVLGADYYSDWHEPIAITNVERTGSGNVVFDVMQPMVAKSRTVWRVRGVEWGRVGRVVLSPEEVADFLAAAGISGPEPSEPVPSIRWVAVWEGYFVVAETSHKAIVGLDDLTKGPKNSIRLGEFSEPVSNVRRLQCGSFLWDGDASLDWGNR